jgi:polysaccharide biosynthesis transport protein
VDHYQTESPNDIREYFRVLRTRKWSIILVTVLLTGSAFFFSLRQTPMYQGTAQVLVQPFATGPVAPVAPNLDTERQLVGTVSVAELAADTLNTDRTPEALIGDLDVEVIPDTEILRIKFMDPDPEFAAAGANGFAHAYIDFRREEAEQALVARAADIQSRMDRIGEQIDEVQADIDGTENQQTREDLNAQLDTLRATQVVLQSQLLELDPGRAITEGGGKIVQEARVPRRPASPNHVRTSALALLAGLALGTGLAFLRERLDDSIRDRQELERRLGAPVLANVPHVAKWRRREETHLIALTDPKNPVSEAYRTLRTNIQFLASKGDIRTILVTSSTAGEGKSATAANLAVVMAQAGRRVVLVSADLRRPRLHRFLGIPNRPGLSLVLSGSASIVNAVQETEVPSLRVIPSGPVPPNPAELLSSDRMDEVLETLRALADLVVIDTPPVLAVADASILAPRVDGTLFVVDAETASRSATQQSRDQMANAGARVLGAVLNRFNLAQGATYPYYYYYYYSQAAAAAEEGAAEEGAAKEGVAEEGVAGESRRERRRRRKAEREEERVARRAERDAERTPELADVAPESAQEPSEERSADLEQAVPVVPPTSQIVPEEQLTVEAVEELADASIAEAFSRDHLTEGLAETSIDEPEAAAEEPPPPSIWDTPPARSAEHSEPAAPGIWNDARSAPPADGDSVEPGPEQSIWGNVDVTSREPTLSPSTGQPDLSGSANGERKETRRERRRRRKAEKARARAFGFDPDSRE